MVLVAFRNAGNAVFGGLEIVLPTSLQTELRTPVSQSYAGQAVLVVERRWHVGKACLVSGAWRGAALGRGQETSRCLSRSVYDRKTG